MTAISTFQPPIRLLPIKEAADILGVPAKSLRSAADAHGLTIRMGRAVRISPNHLEELCELCRCQPKERASSSESEKAESPSMSSKTPETSSAVRAQMIADRLKSSSRTTSPKKPAQVVQLAQRQ